MCLAQACDVFASCSDLWFHILLTVCAAAWAALFSPRRAGYAKQQLDAQSSGGSLRHAAWNSVRGSVRGSSKGGFYSSVANSTSTLMTEFSGGTVNSGSTEMVRLMCALTLSLTMTCTLTQHHT